MCQGWAIIDWSTPEQAASFGGFVAAVPQGKFVVIDMSVDGSGEWQKWGDASFFGAPFIWTTLHDFGGTDGLKGDLARINLIPFAGLPPVANSTVWGTGYTPEGVRGVRGGGGVGCLTKKAPFRSLISHSLTLFPSA